jgi:hypothetical protein
MKKTTAWANVISRAEWGRERERKAEMDDGAVRLSLCVPPIEFIPRWAEPAEDPPKKRCLSWLFSGRCS